MNFGYKFLIVDDNPEHLEKVEAGVKIEFNDCSFHSVSSPQEAIDYCRANVYDLIISASKMPGMNADEMIEKIRDMKNDNFTTGVLVMASKEDSRPSLFKNLSHVLFTERPFNSDSYLQPAKTLLFLKT